MIPIHENAQTGRQYAVLKGAPGQRSIRMSLGTKSRTKARELVKAANLEQVQAAARADLLTAEAITRLKAGKRVTVSDAITDYLESLPVRGRRQSSIRHDTSVLHHWATKLRLGPCPIGAVEDKHVHRFINGPKDLKYATRVRQLSTLRTFLRFCLDRGWIATNPAAQMVVQVDGLKQAQLLEAETSPITEQEVRKILASQPTDSFWHAATLVGWHTGLRLSDVATLQWPSITATRIRVVTSKGVVLVDIETPPELRKLFARLPRSDGRYVFPAQAAEALAGSSNLSQQFLRLCRRLDLDGKSFSGLRHGFAMKSMDDVSAKKLELIREMIGASSLDEVRLRLGHVKSKVTLRYLNHPKA